MRRQLILLLVLCVGILFAGQEKTPPTQSQVEAAQRLLQTQNRSLQQNAAVLWNDLGTPAFVRGQFVMKSTLRSADAVLESLNEFKQLYRMNNAQEEFALQHQESDDIGMTHFKFQQTYMGIPVYARQLVVHVKDGREITAINGEYIPEINLDPVPSLDGQKAVEIAISNQNAVKYRWEDELQEDILERTTGRKSWYPEAKLVVYPFEGHLYLAYHLMVPVELPEPGNWEYFIDARSGEIIHKANTLKFAETTGSGVTVTGQTVSLNTYSYNNTYYLYDNTKPMSSNGGQIRTYIAGSSLPGSYSTDSNNNWSSSSQRAEVSAHYNASLVYDYYYNTHGRNSFDGNGSDLISSAHYGTNYNNAYWNGSQMVYGDGDGSTFIALSGALDVVAHELTHAVTERTANLVYEYQPGALNESFSDVFGELLDRGDWLIGEDVYTPGVSGDALRNMQDPTMGIYNPSNPFGGGQPAHMDQYANLPNTQQGDYGGVHINSGIPNKAFYNTVQSIGWTAAERIYYRALTQYVTSNAQFTDARAALLQACNDLYGSTDGKYTAIENAWAAVGVGSSGGGGGGGSDTYEPNNTMSEAYGPLESGTVYRSYIASSSDVDYYKFTAAASGTATVNLANFPGDYDFFVYNASGTEVARGYTSNDPENKSFSVSAGTYYVKVNGYNGAYSSTDDYELTVTYPTGGGGSTAQWYYETKTYDTPHNYPNNYDNYHEYSKPGAQQVAVHFSQFVTETNYDFVYIYDKNGSEIAKYHGSKSAFWAVASGDYIKVRLKSDYSVTKYGYHIDQVAYYSTGQLLHGLVYNGDIEGAQSDPVDPSAVKVKEFELRGNFPNPFNPTTTIRFVLPEAQKVKVVVYNLAGQVVKTLVNDILPQGLNEIPWDATNQNGQSVSSGVYIYRITAGNQNFVRKMMLVK